MNESRFFGVELETHPVLSSSAIVEVIRKNSGRKVYFSGWKQTHSNSYWHLKTDSTCGGGIARNGWEVASYKAKGSSELKDISSVASALSDAGLVCGEDCGLHVHVDISDFSTSKAGILVAKWIKVESVMMQAVPVRRALSPHCRPIASKLKKKGVRYDPDDLWNIMAPTNFSTHRNPQKKVSLNMVNYATCIHYEREARLRGFWCDASRKTAEFRFPEGTLDGEDVENWVRLFLLFVDSAVCMPSNLKSVLSVDEFLNEFGFSDWREPDLVLWLAERIVKNSQSKKWKIAFEKLLAGTK